MVAFRRVGLATSCQEALHPILQGSLATTNLITTKPSIFIFQYYPKACNTAMYSKSILIQSITHTDVVLKLFSQLIVLPGKKF